MNEVNRQRRHVLFSDLWMDFYLLKSHRSRIVTLFGTKLPRSKEQLHRKLQRCVGSFIRSIDDYSYQSFKDRICIDLDRCTRRRHKYEECPIDQVDSSNIASDEDQMENEKDISKECSKDQMLRDLFLWAVFMNMHEMAKVLLVQMQSRFCAALIASAIFKHYAALAATVDLEEKLRAQALDFETYAANFIDHCYKYDERTACELLFRQIPLFGYITCMQVILSSHTFFLD